MILADTSVWADHLTRSVRGLRDLLEQEQVFMHTYVIGELACGNLPDRINFVAALQHMPALPTVDDSAVLEMIESEQLFGTGLGWVDTHLLASAVDADIPLWSRDKRLAAAARKLDIAYTA